LKPPLDLGLTIALAEEIGIVTEFLHGRERDRVNAFLHSNMPGGWKSGDAMSKRFDEITQFSGG
jgi:hypothetical protein